MEGLFKRGQLLRYRYDGYLARGYDVNQIFVQSVDSDLQIQSAQALLRGLFPMIPDDPDPLVRWNLVPIHTISKKVDSVREKPYEIPSRLTSN